MEILKKLEKRRRYESIFRALLFSLLTALIILIFMTLGVIFEINFSTTLNMLVFGTISTITLYFLFRKTSLRKQDGIAIDLDREYSAKNRLESAIELQESNNPLRNSQHKDTDNFYHGIKIKNSLWLIIITLILLFSLLSLTTYITTLSFQISILKTLDTQLYAKNGKIKTKNEKKEEEPDFAEIAITIPESEMRAKPMDAIAWSGEGRSTKGFRDLKIRFYINGEFKDETKVEFKISENSDKLQKKNITEITLDGEFYLDELDVVPFDVISYYIEGYSNRKKDKGRKVLSLPQFIEVRPFREEAQIIRMNGNISIEMKKKLQKMINLMAMVKKMIRFQLAMNKALFILKTSGFKMDDKIIQEELVGVTKDEYTLKKELDTALNDIPAEMVSPNMMDYLRSAISDMKNSGDKLKILINPEYIPQLDLTKNDNTKKGED
jgi:hypothetical protein